MNALLEELGKHAAAAAKADALADKHRTAIRELLPEARKKGAGPAELERTILGIYAAGTISRWTSAFAPEVPRPGRKRQMKPPARPSGS